MKRIVGKIPTVVRVNNKHILSFFSFETKRNKSLAKPTNFNNCNILSTLPSYSWLFILWFSTVDCIHVIIIDNSAPRFASPPTKTTTWKYSATIWRLRIKKKKAICLFFSLLFYKFSSKKFKINLLVQKFIKYRT